MKTIEIRTFSSGLRKPELRRAQALALIVAIALTLFLVHRTHRNAAAESGATIQKPPEFQLARMSREISLHAVGRGDPWINLSDGHELITPYSGPAQLTQILERNEAQALSLCSADFDEDGVPDLISGYAGPNGGIVTLLRGNVDSIYPNAPEAQERRAEGAFTDAPFLSPAFVFGVPEAADFIGAGDFDGDGHWDVVATAQGSDKLYLLSGDGAGDLGETKRIALPDGVTAMVVGEINRRDGLDDSLDRSRRELRKQRKDNGQRVKCSQLHQARWLETHSRRPQRWCTEQNRSHQRNELAVPRGRVNSKDRHMLARTALSGKHQCATLKAMGTELASLLLCTQSFLRPPLKGRLR